MFRKDSDFEAFERVMVEAHVCQPSRILSYCVLSNHLNRQTDRVLVSRPLLKRTGNQEKLEAQLMGTKEYFLHRGGGTVNGFLNAACKDMSGQPPSPRQTFALRRQLQAGASRSTIVRLIQQEPIACEHQVSVI